MIIAIFICRVVERYLYISFSKIKKPENSHDCSIFTALIENTSIPRREAYAARILQLQAIKTLRPTLANIKYKVVADTFCI